MKTLGAYIVILYSFAFYLTSYVWSVIMMIFYAAINLISENKLAFAVILISCSLYFIYLIAMLVESYQ